MNETTQTTETTTDYSVPTSDVSMDTNDNHADYSYGDYKQDDFSVPTEPGNPLDKKVDEINADESVDLDSLNQMMTEYMRENFDLPDKFKDIGSLINSYKHLETRLGGMKGAPAVYELDEHVFNAYDKDMLQEVTSLARDIGIDNDGVNKLLGRAAEVQNRIEQANWEMELNKLGPNAREEVSRDLQYLNANFTPEMASTIQSMVKTADQYRALQSLIMDHRIGGSPSPAANTPSQAPMTQASLDQMLYAKDDFGNLKMETDSAYASKVMNMMNQFYRG